MEGDNKKRYRAQYLICRSKTKEDYSLMQKEILFVNEGEHKLFSKYEYIDNYIFFLYQEKIAALIRQRGILQLTKHLFGYELTDEQKKYQHFCEVDIIYNLAQINKSKLPSDYKFLFQNQDKRVQKIDEFLGHKLRDLLSYPEALIKKIVINKSDYLYYKMPEENSDTSSDNTDSDSSSSSDSSDSDSDSQSSDDEKQAKKRKEKKKKKDKEKQKQKSKNKQSKKKSKKSREKSKEKKIKKEKNKKKDKDKQKDKDKKKSQNKEKRKHSKSREEKKKKKKQKNRQKDKQKDKKKHQ